MIRAVAPVAFALAIAGLPIGRASAAAPAAPKMAASPATIAAPAAPELAAAAVEASLTRRACELREAARPFEAADTLLADLTVLVRRGVNDPTAWDEPRLRAEAEIGAALLAELVSDLGTWPETVEALAALRPLPAGTPPAVAARLEQLYAQALRRTGRSAEARAVVEALGAFDAMLVIGPFDNERGSGLTVAYEPERGFDRELPVRGKERDVTWRELPVRHPTARVSLDELLRPNEQVVGYLTTAISAPDDRDVVLHVGSPCAFAVHLNGAELVSRAVERPHVPDQDRVVLPLRAGWNRLLVKLAAEDGPWLASLRLTDLEGRALRDVAIDTAHLEAAADTEPRSAGASAEPAPGARGILETLLAADASDVDAARLLALYHLTVHPDDVVDRSARLAARQATGLAPGDAHLHYLLARSNEAEGQSLEEIEVNNRLHALERVLELDPDHVGALLDLAAFCASDSPQPDRVDDLTARALAAAPESWRALRARADHLDRRDRDTEADLLRRRAAEVPEGLLAAHSVTDAAGRLLERGRAEESERLLRAALARDVLARPALDALLPRLADAARTDELLTLVRQALAASPDDTWRMLEAARLLEYAGATAAARGLCDEALAVCPEHTGALLQLARMDVRAGETDAAAARLDEVVRLDPGNDKARRHRALLVTEERERFETPYQWDAAELAALPIEARDGNDPVEMLRRTTVYRVHPDGTEHRYEHVALRALNLGGVKSLDTYSIVYPTDAQLQVFQVRVVHPDGRFERAPSPRSGGGRGSDPYGYRFYDLPPLGVGDVVDVEYRIDESQPDVFGEYFGSRHMFYPEQVDPLAPTRHSELVVLAPPEVPIHVAERNADLLEKTVEDGADGLRVLRWVARDLPRPDLQTGMPDPVEFAPVVDVTTFADWNAFATWWWSFIQKEFVTTPEMKAKVAELTAGLRTEREKVEAINRFVAQEIRYNSWPFGTHGYEPFSAATIFERRFGDCKDKSILLRQMLAEVGVEAIPVLINARYTQPDEPLAAAMVGQFNHCIAYLPPTDERDGYYLDATADHNPVDYLRADDQGARVLHVTGRGGEIRQIPYAEPGANSLRRRYVVRLDGDGGGAVDLVDESNGLFGVRMRYRFAGEQGDIEKKLAEQMKAEFGTVRIEAVDTSDLEDITTPARLAARFTTENLMTPEGALHNLETSFDDLGFTMIATEPESERVYELVLDRPFGHDTTVLYELPPGAQVARLPQSVEIDAPGLLAYRQTVTRTDAGLEVRREFELKTRRVTREQYGAFRDALREVELAEQRTVGVRLAGPEGTR